MSTGSRIAWGRLARLAGIFAALVVVFVALMTAVYALPQTRIVANLRASLPRLQAEGLYPQHVLDHRAYRLDDYTDALMLDTSIATREGGALVVAMAVDHRSDLEPIAGLKASVDGSVVGRGPYAYYWHGYQVALRPLLMLFSYGDLRYLNILSLGVLALIVMVALRRVAGARAEMAFFVSLLLTGFYIVPMSLQFSGVTYIMLLAMLAVSAAASSGVLERVDVEMFLVIGMVTAFVDLLTAPLLTLGMPLVYALALVVSRREARDIRSDLRMVARICVAWAAGYGGTWVAKWAIATAVLRTDVFKLAAGQLLFRTGLDSGGLQFIGALRRNILDLFPLVRADSVGRLAKAPIPAAVMALLMGTVLVVAIVFLWRSRDRSGAAALTTPVLLAAPLPYLWFVVVNNHSSIHNWFTYRIQAIAIFAVMFVLSSAIDSEVLVKRVRRSAIGRVFASPSGAPFLGGESVSAGSGPVRRDISPVVDEEGS